MSNNEGSNDAPADASTPLVLSLDRLSYGNIDPNEDIDSSDTDIDWFRFDAEANTTYLFRSQGLLDYDGWEVGYIAYARPDVVDATGTKLATGGIEYDNATAGEVLFRSDTAQTVFIAVSSEGGYSYSVQAQVLDPAQQLAPVMRFGDLAHDVSDPLQFYFVPGGLEVAHGSNRSYYRDQSMDWTLSEQHIILDILDHVATFTTLRFEVTQDANAADMTFLKSADIVSGYYRDDVFMNAGNVPFSDYGKDFNYDYGFASYVESGPENLMGIAPSVLAGAAFGGASYAKILKSLGNGLMLASPENALYDSEKLYGVTRSDPMGAFDLAQTVFTAMARTQGWNAAPVPETPDGTPVGTLGYSALDIGTLQQMYGVNRSHATGDDDYRVDALGHYMTIWDAGGTDTLRATSEIGAVVDLRAATFDYTAGGGGYVSHGLDSAGGVTIAKGALIENARTGSGADVIEGNYVANLIRSGDGDDAIRARNGDDAVAGEGGDDRVHGGAGNDRLFGGSGFDTLFGDAGDDRLLGGWGQDVLDGGTGYDVLIGAGGADRLFGGDGNDWLHGGGKRDVLSGGAGQDTLWGGWDADLFVFATGDGRDRLRDFKPGTDQIDLIGLGLSDFNEVVAAAENKTEYLKLNFGGGDVLYLMGLSQTDLNALDFILA